MMRLPALTMATGLRDVAAAHKIGAMFLTGCATIERGREACPGASGMVLNRGRV